LVAAFAWPVASAARLAVNVAPLFALAAEAEPPLASGPKAVLAFATVAAFGRLGAVAVEAAATAAVTGGVPSVVAVSALALLGAEVLGAEVLGAEVLELAAPVAIASPCGLVLAVPPVAPTGASAGSLGCGVCCAAGGGLAGAAVLASSQAENGCDSLSWLLAVAWARWDAKSEAAAETSDVILGILGTARTPARRHKTLFLIATDGPSRTRRKVSQFHRLRCARRDLKAATFALSRQTLPPGAG
jgi:hypothetical protein